MPSPRRQTRQGRDCLLLKEAWEFIKNREQFERATFGNCNLPGRASGSRYLKYDNTATQRVHDIKVEAMPYQKPGRVATEECPADRQLQRQPFASEPRP